MTDNSSAMQDTMNQIFGVGESTGLRKDHLLKEIADIENDIQQALDVVKLSNDEPYSYAPISPLQANERQRAIVFLKKDLEKKKLEYEELSNES